MIDSLQSQVSDYTDAIEMMSAMGSFAQPSLEAISREHPALVSKLVQFDPIATSATFAGLLTLPVLQSNCYRIENLIHLALIHCRGRQKPTPKLVAQAFNELGKGSCGRMEDPSEDMFVTQVRTECGNFRILEGIWEGNSYFLQKFLDTLEGMPRGSGYDDIRASVFALLQLSDLICERAGLYRNQLGAEFDKDVMSLGAAKLHVESRYHVHFSFDELRANLIEPRALAPFLFMPTDRQKLAGQLIGNTDLERHPILRDNDHVYVVLPTAISAAIRYFIVQRMTEAGMRELLCKGIANSYSRAFSSLMLLGTRLGTQVAFHHGERTATAQIGMQYDLGHFLQVIFFTDNLADFEETGLAGVNPASVQIDDVISPKIAGFQKHAMEDPDFRDGITMIVGCGVGRGTFAPFEGQDEKDWRIVFCSAYDFETLSWTREFKPETLWRILEAKQRAEHLGLALQNGNGLLNLVAWSRSLGGHVVPHAEIPDQLVSGAGIGMMYVTQNELRTLRHEVAIGCDPRVEQFVDGQWLPIRKNRLSIFEDDARAPLYASEVMGSSGLPITAYLTSQRTWWAELVVPEGLSGSFTWERFAALGAWLSRAADVLEEIPGLPPGPICWRAKFKGIQGDFDHKDGMATFEEARAAITTEATSGQQTFCTVAAADYERCVFHPENIAERALVRALIDGVNRIAGSPLSEADCDKFLGEIVKSPNARNGHAFLSKEFRDHVREDIGAAVQFMDKQDDAFMRLGLGWRNRPQSQGSKINGKNECQAFLNATVQQIEEELCTDLKQYERQAFLQRILRNMEYAANDRDRWRKTSAAMIALHGRSNETLKTLSEHQFRLTSVFQTSRILAEIAVCECPDTGRKKVGKIELSRLMAKAGLLFHIGGWSDAIRWGMMEPEIRITPLGDIHAKFNYVDEVVLPFAEKTSAERMDSDVLGYSRNLEEYVPQARTGHLLEKQFTDAWFDQFGLTFDETRIFVDHCENLGVKAGKGVVAVGRRDFENINIEGQMLSTDKALALLDQMLLKPRAAWRDIPEGYNDRDRQPWRFRRRLSLMRKPILQIDESDNPMLLFAPGQIRECLQYMLVNLHRGEFPQEQLSPKMRVWAGKSADIRGAAFAKEVSLKLTELGWQTDLEVRLTKLLGKSFNTDYGDVDVLAWDPASGRVLVIECKDVHFRKTYGEIAEHLADFRGELRENGRKDYLLKHLDRVALLRREADALQKYVGLDKSPKIESHLMFKNTVPMEFALRTIGDRVAVSSFDQLSSNLAIAGNNLKTA
jgi:hypothetical protein